MDTKARFQVAIDDLDEIRKQPTAKINEVEIEKLETDFEALYFPLLSKSSQLQPVDNKPVIMHSPNLSIFLNSLSDPSMEFI